MAASYQLPQATIVKLVHLKDVHLGLFYLVVKKLITNKIQNIFFI